MADETNPSPKSIIDVPVTPAVDNEFSDDKLLGILVRSCRSNKLPRQKVHRLWEAVAYNTGTTPEFAKALCERFGANPDQKVSRD